MNLAVQSQAAENSLIATHQAPLSIGSLHGIPADTVATIAGYAFNVINYVERIRANSRGLCISLWHCKTAYIRAFAGEGVSHAANSGWDDFCRENFGFTGLSVSNIRTAVKVGEKLAQMQENDIEGFEALSSLSRAALFALAHSPEEVIVEVKETLKNDPTASFTAPAIQKLKAEHRIAQEQVNELQVSNSDLETTVADLNAMITAKDNEVISLKDQIEDLNQKLKTPVESLVETLPAGVKNASEFLASITKESTEKKAEVEKLEASILGLRKSMADLKETSDVITELKQDIAKLTEKYSHVLAKKASDKSASAKAALAETAIMLHALADQLTSNS